MNYKYFLVLICFPIMNLKALSQKDSMQIARNAVYLEIGGSGGYGSLNYERTLLIENQWLIAARLGISTYQLKDFTNTFNPDILLPLSIHSSYGKNQKVEFSIGQTIANIVRINLSTFEPKRSTNLHTIISLGYRYQKNDGGFIFRCAYTPIVEFNTYYRHWASISIGYSF